MEYASWSQRRIVRILERPPRATSGPPALPLAQPLSTTCQEYFRPVSPTGRGVGQPWLLSSGTGSWPGRQRGRAGPGSLCCRKNEGGRLQEMWTGSPQLPLLPFLEPPIAQHPSYWRVNRQNSKSNHYPLAQAYAGDILLWHRFCPFTVCEPRWAGCVLICLYGRFFFSLLGKKSCVLPPSRAQGRVARGMSEKPALYLPMALFM